MPHPKTYAYGRWAAVMSFRRRTRLDLLLTLVTAVPLLVLIGASFRSVLWGEQKSRPVVTPAEATIPSALGRLPLVETVTGDEGLAQVNSMHGQDISLDRGFIAQ